MVFNYCIEWAISVPFLAYLDDSKFIGLNGTHTGEILIKQSELDQNLDQI